MNKTVLKKQPLAIALGILLAGAGAINQLHADSFELITSASAAQGEEGKGAGGKGGQGGPGAGGPGAGGQGGGAGGSSSLEGSVLKGKRSVSGEVDDDSDRPEWAGGDKEANPHRGTGNPNPGTNKGDDYGDLWVILREEDSGDPIYLTLPDGTKVVQPIAFYDANPDPLITELVMITDAEGNPVLLDLNEEGEVIPGQTKTLPDGTVVLAVTSEVEFGRANLVRAPGKVLMHALEEVLSKLASATSLTFDPIDGRLIIDGVKIDSPLENLALYVALLDDRWPKQATPDEYNILLTWAAAFLAAAGDKTRDVDYVDYVYYLNNIMDLDVDFSTFTYDRSVFESMTVDYLYYTDETHTATATATVNLADYLAAINGAITDTLGIEAFTQLVDDRIELIEFTHTQVFDGVLPGTI